MDLLGFGGMLELPLVMAVLIAVNGLAVAVIARLVWDTNLGFIPWFGLVMAAIVVEMIGIYLVGTMIDRFRGKDGARP